MAACSRNLARTSFVLAYSGRVDSARPKARGLHVFKLATPHQLQHPRCTTPVYCKERISTLRRGFSFTEVRPRMLDSSSDAQDGDAQLRFLSLHSLPYHHPSYLFLTPTFDYLDFEPCTAELLGNVARSHHPSSTSRVVAAPVVPKAIRVASHQRVATSSSTRQQSPCCEAYDGRQHQPASGNDAVPQHPWVTFIHERSSQDSGNAAVRRNQNNSYLGTSTFVQRAALHEEQKVSCCGRELLIIYRISAQAASKLVGDGDDDEVPKGLRFDWEPNLSSRVERPDGGRSIIGRKRSHSDPASAKSVTAEQTRYPTKRMLPNPFDGNGRHRQRSETPRSTPSSRRRSMTTNSSSSKATPQSSATPPWIRIMPHHRCTSFPRELSGISFPSAAKCSMDWKVAACSSIFNHRRDVRGDWSWVMSRGSGFRTWKRQSRQPERSPVTVS
jgi:hypothetical protein